MPESYFKLSCLGIWMLQIHFILFLSIKAPSIILIAVFCVSVHVCVCCVCVLCVCVVCVYNFQDIRNGRLSASLLTPMGKASLAKFTVSAC